MPVILNAKHADPNRWSDLNWPQVHADALETPQCGCLHIGLVNNMADAAMEATEHQFLTLLDAASGEMRILVTLFALPEVARTPWGQQRVSNLYGNIEELWEQPSKSLPAALIVTGREPLTTNLRDEVYWPSLQRILAWTRKHARSTVWSCLAAHAAVLGLDGVERVRSQHKHFGIFTCEQAAPHVLLDGAPTILRIPHSRWNGVSETELGAKGYQVLTRSADGGVDMFVKQDAGLFVFFQGHPEYEPATLLGEYRRNVGRYLKCEMETYPLLPSNYFDESTERSLRELEAKALRSRQKTLLDEVTIALENVRIQNGWAGPATRIYRNWLTHISENKPATV
jgi:homoserine O-succinyltransferase